MFPQQQFLNLQYPNPLPDIPPGGNSPHPPFPLQFPPEITVFLTLLLILYIALPARTKLLSVVLAICFSGIEPTFYMLTKEDPITGAVDIAWEELMQGRLGRHPHTTYEQFAVNLLFSGPLFLLYHSAFERFRNTPKPTQASIHLRSPFKWGYIEWARCLATPFLIWGLEIVEGFVLIAAYGWNPAWIYSGDDAWFLGTINLGYWKYWIPLGVLLEVVMWQVVRKISNRK
ncbi:hypothetical protein HDU98_001628 [Podochytrium sp. JEL0797]|nr:hypothetical protein HDU98_001628 [Podochytrium sp. JEL0797]